MPLVLYSTIVAIGSVSLGVFALGAVLWSMSKAVREKCEHVPYETYMGMIALISIVWIIGALIYEFFYSVPTCFLCWWQRIFLFPISIIASVTFWKHIHGNEIITMILSFFGCIIGVYHYILHLFEIFHRDASVMTICDASGVSCSEYGNILIFGWITLPFMALMLFFTIFVLSLFAQKTSRWPHA